MGILSTTETSSLVDLYVSIQRLNTIGGFFEKTPMDTTTMIAVIVAASLAWFVILFSAIRFFLKRLEKKRAEEVREKFKGKKILRISTNAVFMGQASGAFGYVKGNGVLVLTPDEMYFQLWAPRRELRIPANAIIETKTPTSFRSRTVFRPLLQVDFTDQNGAADSAAWCVPELEKWVESLKRLNR